jgi:hypothetical protein
MNELWDREAYYVVCFFSGRVDAQRHRVRQQHAAQQQATLADMRVDKRAETFSVRGKDTIGRTLKSGISDRS